MTDERDQYARVHSILSDARSLPRAELDAYLARACGEDPPLRAQVLELLEAGRSDDKQAPFAEERLEDARAALEGVLASATADWLPEKVGDYTILRQLGRGGMGVVYEAQQASPQRRVAIKLLHPMQQTTERLRRFRHEAALLGRLQHPGIAQIFEASTYDVGRGPQPFFAMELVEGTDIRTHCERYALDRAARMELLARVADAVQYAHEHGIIHRDLKPDNVLVDPRGHPRILDFGVAHASTNSTALSSIVTEDGQLVGTLAYMAPEQLTESSATLSARVDVFALGVLGFELLLGRLPREVGDLPLPKIVAMLARSEPSRAGALDTSLRGDVETILGKALETDPARRYESAAAFAGDLRRHLAHQPIHAHPPSTVYLVRKFVKRNRVLVVGAATTLLVAVAGAVVATGFALEATERAREVEQRASDVLRLSLAQDYEDLLASADDLWPPHPVQIPALEAWIAAARALTAELPSLAAKRDELRRLALPRSAEQRQLERESHRDYPELERLEGELPFRRRALAQRRDGQSPPPAEVEWDAMPRELVDLDAKARALVDPRRTVFGQEPLGLALAERAIELANDEERSRVAQTLSQAYFALGRDEESLGLAAMALDEASPENRPQLDMALANLEREVARTSSEQGLAAEEVLIAELAARADELRQRVDVRQLWTFPEETETRTRARWWLNQLGGLMAEIQSLNTPGAGLLAEDGVSPESGWSVVRRLAFARELEANFAPGGEFDRRWEEALPAIRSTYPDLDLAPQMGLVPIGPDPQSGLWEFWHVQTGSEPRRDGDGRLLLKSTSGLVFVLLPGGTFWMGAQSQSPNGRNFDRDSRNNEGPVHEARLSAYLFSKYEMTQDQWARATGKNPARWTRQSVGGGWIEGPHPVEQVSWLDCMQLMRTQGLQLPSEAQWEYGCRAGTDTPRPFAAEDIAKCANLADLSHRNEFPGVVFSEPWDDGASAHAPVDWLAPNAFGLHHVIGNVWEWCRDGYDRTFYAKSPHTNPVNPVAGCSERPYRGGGAINAAVTARTAIRFDDAPSLTDLILGLRPARAITD